MNNATRWLIAALCSTLAVATACGNARSSSDDGSGRDAREMPDDDADRDAPDDGRGDDGGQGDDSGPDDGEDAESDGESDVGEDAAAPDGSDDDIDDPDAPPCPDATTAFTGVHVENISDDPTDVLGIGDRIRVTVGIHAPSASVDPLWLTLDHGNLVPDESTLTLDDATTRPVVTGDRWTLGLAGTQDAVVSYEAAVESDGELVAVFASLRQEEGRCEGPRTRSGALFQVAGGTYKTPRCIDMADYRSLQIAPLVETQNTDAYRDLNGVREDLRADSFIFCPQQPTIVHAAEFCIERAGDQEVSLAGGYLADGSWEVDDFILIEIFQGGERVDDGFTTQHHSGGTTFYCNPTDTLMCTEGCVAELVEIATDRRLIAIANVSAEGERARHHDDGAVVISGLLPAGEGTTDVRITALDVGEVGTLTPSLYLISADP